MKQLAEYDNLEDLTKSEVVSDALERFLKTYLRYVQLQTRKLLMNILENVKTP